MDLADFLLARIAEDEQDASDVHEVDCDLVRQGAVDPAFGWTCSCGHPARILAECQAKRWIVGAYDILRDAGAEAVVAVLALPYADHPDYSADWRP